MFKSHKIGIRCLQTLDALGWDVIHFWSDSIFPCCMSHVIISSISSYLTFGYGLRNFVQVVFVEPNCQRTDVLIQILYLGCALGHERKEVIKTEVMPRQGVSRSSEFINATSKRWIKSATFMKNNPALFFCYKVGN